MLGLCWRGFEFHRSINILEMGPYVEIIPILSVSYCIVSATNRAFSIIDIISSVFLFISNSGYGFKVCGMIVSTTLSLVIRVQIK